MKRSSPTILAAMAALFACGMAKADEPDRLAILAEHLQSQERECRKTLHLVVDRSASVQPDDLQIAAEHLTSPAALRQMRADCITWRGFTDPAGAQRPSPQALRIPQALPKEICQETVTRGPLRAENDRALRKCRDRVAELNAGVSAQKATIHEHFRGEIAALIAAPRDPKQPTCIYEELRTAFERSPAHLGALLTDGYDSCPRLGQPPQLKTAKAGGSNVTMVITASAKGGYEIDALVDNWQAQVPETIRVVPLRQVADQVATLTGR